MAGSLKSLSYQSSKGSSRSSSSSSSSQNVTGSGSFNRIPLDRGGMTLAPIRESGRELGRDSGHSAEAPENSGWELRLSFGQLIVFWSAICGTLIMVFLFGLYAGREQGVQAALESRSGEGIRLPIMNAAPAGLDISSGAPASTALAALPAETSTAPEPAAAIPASAPVAPSEVARASEAPPAPAVAELSPPSLPPPASAPESLASTELAPPKELAEEQPVPAKTGPAKPGLEKKAEPVKTVNAENIRAGWYLQVAATRTSSESSAIVRKLQAVGLKPIVESAKIGGSAYYRVNLGPYPSKDAALKARKAAISSKAAKGEPFAKQIK